tara:strand:+ start:481 stop:792 length:312 start_codon:yes stop_codon:yes gene_type:complete
MTFSELTWSADCFNEVTNQNMGFQAQYEADNGFLIVIDTVLADQTEEAPNGVALATATESGQLYNCTIWGSNREEGGSAISSYELQNSSEIDTRITELKAMTI